jgi:hypothetical protein
LPEAAALQD